MAIKSAGVQSPEERQYLAVASRIQEVHLLGEIMKDPKLLSRLGEEVIRINALNEAERKERDDAVDILARAEKALAAEEQLYADLETLRAQYAKEHADKLQDVDGLLERSESDLGNRHAELDKAHQAKLAEIEKRAADIKADHAALDKREQEIAVAHAGIDQREAGLKAVAADLDNRKFLLDQQQKRIEDVKKALAG